MSDIVRELSPPQPPADIHNLGFRQFWAQLQKLGHWTPPYPPPPPPPLALDIGNLSFRQIWTQHQKLGHHPSLGNLGFKASKVGTPPLNTPPPPPLDTGNKDFRQFWTQKRGGSNLWRLIWPLRSIFKCSGCDRKSVLQHQFCYLPFHVQQSIEIKHYFHKKKNRHENHNTVNNYYKVR